MLLSSQFWLHVYWRKFPFSVIRLWLKSDQTNIDSRVILHVIELLNALIVQIVSKSCSSRINISFSQDESKALAVVGQAA